MSSLEDELVDPILSEEDFLIREIIRTHDHDGRELDSEVLLHLVENIFSIASGNVVDAQLDEFDVGNIVPAGVDEHEPISLIIYKISKEMLSPCFKDGNPHLKTIVLLEKIGHYRWDAKVVLAIASFAQSFGLSQLILKEQPLNRLADLLAIVKGLPKAVSMSQPNFKAMNMLINTILKLTKIITRFEGLHLQHKYLDVKYIVMIKRKIYTATYWIFRSILVSSSRISDLRSSRNECTDETVITACSLHSLGMKLNSLCCELEERMAICLNQIDKRLDERLLHMFKEDYIDNQKVLSTLFGFQHEFPLEIASSQEKANFGLVELKNKTVILLISKPELLPLHKIIWLVDRTYNHQQHKKLEGSYAILWVPIQSSQGWSLTDKSNVEFLSNRLPWFSIRKPQSLHSSIISFIRKEWNFEEDPLMVVLNENGVVTNSNAMDIVWIWGLEAFPFSNSRETELWGLKNWSIDFMINGISALLTQWVEEGKNICIYGSENLDWIREFTATINKIKSSEIQLKLIYIGCRNPEENVKNIISAIDQENLSTSLTCTNVQFFWFRLECIKRSLEHQEHSVCSDMIASELAEMLDFSDNKKNWAMIGKGSSSTNVFKRQLENLEEGLNIFFQGKENVETYRSAVGKCDHTEVVLYEEGLIGNTVVCNSCKCPMEKFVMYKCDLNSES